MRPKIRTSPIIRVKSSVGLKMGDFGVIKPI